MAGTSVKVRESNSLMYSVPQDTDAPCRRKGSNSPTTRNKRNRYAIHSSDLVPSEVFSNHASKFVAVWLTEFLLLHCISKICATHN